MRAYTMYADRSTIKAVSLSMDDQLVAGCLEDGSVEVWSVPNGELVYTHRHHHHHHHHSHHHHHVSVNACSWHPSRLVLAYAGEESTSTTAMTTSSSTGATGGFVSVLTIQEKSFSLH